MLISMMTSGMRSAYLPQDIKFKAKVLKVRMENRGMGGLSMVVFHHLKPSKRSSVVIVREMLHILFRAVFNNKVKTAVCICAHGYIFFSM